MTMHKFRHKVIFSKKIACYRCGGVYRCAQQVLGVRNRFLHYQNLQGKTIELQPSSIT